MCRTNVEWIYRYYETILLTVACSRFLKMGTHIEKSEREKKKQPSCYMCLVLAHESVSNKSNVVHNSLIFANKRPLFSNNNAPTTTASFFCVSL